MAYADSAIDYHFSIENISLDQGRMTVAYYTADSTDGRPTVYRNVSLDPSEFNDSDIQVRAHEQSGSVVYQWDEILEKNNANPTFNPADYIGDSYSNRYKPVVVDSYPVFNSLTHKISIYDSEGYDEIRRKYAISAMSDSEKADYRETLVYSRQKVWITLMEEGRLDSAVSTLGLYTGSHDSEEIQFLLSDKISFSDKVLVELRSSLGYSDSDFAALI